MSSEIKSPSEDAIRFSRVMNLKHLVAMGSSLSVGLGVFILLGVFARLAGVQSLITPYLVMALAALPIVLTYSERLAVLPGSGGAYNLARTSKQVWLVYLVGWFLLGGFAALIALLGWGIALYLDLLFTLFFDSSFDLTLIATAVIGVLALNNILGSPSVSSSRSTFVYGAIIVLAIIIFRDLLYPATPNQPSYFVYNTLDITTLATLMMSSLWGLQFILNVRNEMHRPTRTLMKSMLLTLVLGAGLGMLSGWVIMHYYGVPRTLTPLAEIITDGGLVPANLASIVFAVAGLTISSIALRLAFVHYLRLIDDMVRDGFLPERILVISDKHHVSVVSLALIAIISILLVNLIEIVVIVGVVAIFFLWTAAAAHLPEAFQSKPNLPEKRFPKLPFHPLFPWLTIAVGIFMPFTIEYRIWLIALGWIAVGVVFYLVYARQSGKLASRRETVVGADEIVPSELKDKYVILVAVSNPETAKPLLETAAKLAEARGGVLLVLKVLVLVEQVPPNLRRQLARKEWETLVQLLSENESLVNITTRPFVRLAPSPASGILGAISEAGVDLLLLGWEGKHQTEEVPINATLDPVIKRAKCEVAILHGTLPQTIKHILVPTAGGPYAPIALDIGRDLSGQDEDRRIVVGNLVTEFVTPEVEAQAKENIQSTLDLATGNGANVDPLVLEANTVEEGIIAQALKSDLLLLGAAKQGFPERPYFGGLPVDIAKKSTVPTILTRGIDTDGAHTFDRLWELLSDALPTLSLARQDEVYQNMRESAQPNVDFFVLITLSATIATLGLLQNSAAVIIGAMLVAPLMTPILAVAMAMVHGNLRLLLVAAEATAKGSVLAIMVGMAVVIFSPIDAATSEILARTQPNILDLMVALASGAAAGYALSRKEVAAALPGVAIAAALVPPLCVVGYGLGTSQLDMAGGALLLFITNLVAIIFAAAGTFLALGFHPARTETGELMRGLKVTLISLGVILVILVFTTVVTVVDSNQQAAVEEIFTDEMVSRAAEVKELSTNRTRDGFIITATIIDIKGNQLSTGEISKIEQELSDALGGEPVKIDATIIPGNRAEFEGSLVVIRQIEDMYKSELGQYDAQVILIEVTETDNGYTIVSSVVALGDDPITQLDMTTIQQNMNESLNEPVSIEATIITGDQINVAAPTPTPEP